MADTPENPDDPNEKTVIQIQPPEQRSTPPQTASGATPAQPTEEGESLIGAVINNNYKIQELINVGGMGEVYRGEQVFTSDPVAIKIVLPALAQDEKVLTLFKREARILSQLADEAIVRYFNFVHDPALDRFCLIMDFIDGIPLSEQVAIDGPISLDAARMLMVRLAKGLDKAHQREVTHRDLSPDNVMLPGGDVDKAVLIDFGIAKSTELTEGTLHGQLAGKFKYVSPEQLGHFEGIISPRTDIYGLALLMAAAMRGRAIDMGSSVVEAVNARRAIPDLTGVYPELQPLIAHMLEPDPAMRPARMLDVAAMVDNPSLIPARYTSGMAPSLNTDSKATILGSIPPFGSAPPDAATPSTARNTGIQSPPGLSAPQPAPTPFSTTPPESTNASMPKPAEKGGAVNWIGILVVVAALGGGGWFAMTQGIIPGLRLTPEDVVTEPTSGDDAAESGEAGGMPSPDETTRQGFLAVYGAKTEACTYATRITSGENAGKLAVFSSRSGALPGLPQAYREAFGAEPAIINREIKEPQCAVTDLVRGLQGRADIEPVLTLDADSVESGGFIVGRIRDTRGRAIWLALVTATGEVFDLSSRLQSQPDGSLTFEFGIGLGANAETAPQLLVALAASDPVLSLVAITDGEPANKVMPLILREISAKQGGAAASLGWVLLTPPE